jgi:molybdopterin/thiamine biosynthesis adenylyltransferase
MSRIDRNDFTIVVAGAGGTGGNVVTNLCRLIEPIKFKTIRIIVADGDLIEKKNRKRQPYSFSEEGQNKAEVLVRKCANAFDVNITAYSHYIEDIDTLKRLLEQSLSTTKILVGCVDNIPTRQMFHEYFEKTDNLFYIDSGNDEWDGQIVTGIKANRKIMSEPIGLIYPEILEDTTGIFKSKESCMEVREERPQQFITNLQAAVIVLSYLSDIIITQDLTSHQSTFNIKNKAMRTYKAPWAQK